MLNSFKSLKSGNLEGCKNEHLFPILRWCSGSKKDLHSIAKVNRVWFGLDAEVQKSLLYSVLTDRNPFIKYPKAKKEEKDKVLDLKKELFRKWIGWSIQELDRAVCCLNWVDFQVIADDLGIDNKERKVLGLPVIKSGKKKGSKKSGSLAGIL